MSDETQTQTPDAAKPATNQQPAAGAAAPKDDPVGVAMRSLQDDNRKLDADLKATQAKLTERDAEVATLKSQVEGFGKAQRESAIVGKLRNALPHATDSEVRGALAGLHETGKVDRYSDKPDDAARAALELIKTEFPSLTRAPTTGGGTPGVRVGPSAPRHPSLVG